MELLTPVAGILKYFGEATTGGFGACPQKLFLRSHHLERQNALVHSGIYIVFLIDLFAEKEKLIP